MAVTQISRIQVRKGRKLSPTGVPQLAGAEFAWVVDSQELFIGNGSISEGAPYVGNTKILTEHDNILSLISSYKFGGTEAGSPVPYSVTRSFQDKLDEYISVFDFGATGDGISNEVDAFETAFDQLFQNPLAVYRKVLVVPNGEYVFDNDLRLPNYVELIGETRDNVILKFTGESGLKLVNVIGEIEDLNQFTESQRPENIKVSNLTIINSRSVLSGSRSVLFDNVKFKGDGEYELSDPMDQSNLSPTLYWDNSQLGVETTDLKFKNCSFENLELAIKCNQSVLSQTSLTIDDCQFKNIDTGILVLGIADQSNNWKIINSSFTNTANHGIYISAGTDTLIRECTFENSGVNLDGSMATNSVYFGQSQNNLVIDCLSDRQKDQTKGLSPGELRNIGYIPEVYGANKVTFLNRNQADIENLPDPTEFALVSAYNEYIKIDYLVKLRTGDSRRGELIITIDKNNAPNEGSVNLTDTYSYYSVPGQAMAVQSGTSLDVKFVQFGQFYIGCAIFGEDFRIGTRITQIDPFLVDLDTGIGIYTVDRLPLLDPTGFVGPEAPGDPITFERDVIKNLKFTAEFSDNIADSTTGETIVLRYQFTPQRTPYPGNYEIPPQEDDIAGVISFDISYEGTGV